MPNQFRVEGGAWVSGRDHPESQWRKSNDLCLFAAEIGIPCSST